VGKDRSVPDKALAAWANKFLGKEREFFMALGRAWLKG
jgi:hypothetical protein